MRLAVFRFVLRLFAAPRPREELFRFAGDFFFAAGFRFAELLPFAAALPLPLDFFAAARPPSLPPFFAGLLFTFLPRPEPLFFPPPVIAFTVAQALASAVFFDAPRFSYPSSMCSACRFCLLV